MSMKHHVLALETIFHTLGNRKTQNHSFCEVGDIYIYILCNYVYCIYMYVIINTVYIYMYNYIYILIIIYHTDSSGLIHLSNLSKSTPNRRIRCHALLYSLVASQQAPKVKPWGLPTKFGTNQEERELNQQKQVRICHNMTWRSLISRISCSKPGNCNFLISNCCVDSQTCPV